MPNEDALTRLNIDCTTGEVTEEPLTEEEIAERRHAQENPPPQEPTVLEQLNEGIQNAQGLADIKQVFADWTEHHRDRL